MWNRLFLLVILALLFASCEDNMFLRSEKKLKSEIQGSWERQFLGDTSKHYREVWNFDGDKLYTTYTEFFPPDIHDGGALDFVMSDNVDTIVISGFKIDAKVFRAYLKLQLQQGDTVRFIDKWELVELQDDILYIAADDPDDKGAIQREFYRIK